MSVFHSILHVPLRVEAAEQLSLGLLMRAGNDVFFRYSAHKLQLVKDLMPEARHRLLRQSLQNIEKTLTEDGRRVDTFQYELFSAPAHQSGFSQESYLAYLSRYHHNLLTYTSPQKIDLPGTAPIFLRLYEKLIDRVPAAELVDHQAFDIEEAVSEQLYPRLTGHVNVNLQLTSQEIPTLFLPTKVSFIGRNEAPMVGRVIDFSKRAYNLQHDLTEMYTLVKAFEEHGEQRGVYYVIGQEPPRHREKEHATWATIRRSKTVEYVDVSETERVVEYARAHKVEPFLEGERK